MPSPGDENNLKPNLKTIASLRTGGAGAKLDYDPKTMRFSVSEGDLFQGISRMFSGNSITKESSFGTPIRDVFAAARAKSGTDKEIPSLLQQALNGLELLKKTYAGDAEKLRTLNSILNDANLGVNREHTALSKMREKYRTYLVYGFSQSIVLDQSVRGVCDALTLDWARRILISGKSSWAVTKHSQDPIPNQLTPDLGEKARMMGKVDKRLRDLQGTLVRGKETNMRFGPQHLANEPDGKTKYGSFARLTNFDRGDAIAIPMNATGSDIMSAALTRASAAEVVLAGGPFVWVVSLSNQGGGGHAIAFHLVDLGNVHFFDPNLGEFSFPLGTVPLGKSDPQLSFWNEWWDLLYGSPPKAGTYTRWKLKGVERA